MAQCSQTSEIHDPRRLIEAHLRESFGRVVYSHKTHEKCADMLLTQLSRIKLWQCILSAGVTSGFIAAFLGAGPVGVALGALVAATLLVLNAYTKNYDLGELAQKHRQAAADLWLIREKHLSLITDLAVGTSTVEEVSAKRDVLLEQLHSIYGGCPSTTYQAYRKAQDALKKHEDMTFSDEEIDAFLPRELHRH